MGKEKEKMILDRKIEEALRKGVKPEEHSSALPPYGFYIPSDASLIPGPTEPWVYAMHEPPSLPSTPEEAHLYLWPSHMAGKGNHSFACHAEWDIPRDLLVPDVLCRQCVIDEAQKIIAAEDAEGTDPKWITKRGEVVLKIYVQPEFVTTIHEEPRQLRFEGAHRAQQTCLRRSRPHHSRVPESCAGWVLRPPLGT